MKKWFFTLSLTAVLLFGCAMMRESESGSKEKLLIAAGFQMRPASTPQKQTSLAAMTPYKLHSHLKNGSTYYSYADPRKNCLYIGGPQQYAAYRKLAQEQNIAMQQQMAVTEMDAESWHYWGPWTFGGVSAPSQMTSW